MRKHVIFRHCRVYFFHSLFLLVFFFFFKHKVQECLRLFAHSFESQMLQNNILGKQFSSHYFHPNQRREEI